jgi:tryptophan synthase alpha chain
MQNRIDSTFAKLRDQNQKGFMAYITGGDPTLKRTVEIAVALEDAGVHFLEIGIPFSDPLADGIANQLGAQRALAAGTNVPSLLQSVAEIRRRTQMPLVLYSYLNPLFQYGLSRFEQDAANAGVDGLLLLDLPPDEASPATEPGIHRIRLVAPTTSESRIARIVSQASGFIYYVSREGVTGERSDISQGINEQVARIRSYTALPVAVGFGISTPDQARTVSQFADAVVVGSAIVRRIGEIGDSDALAKRIGAFVQPLVSAIES